MFFVSYSGATCKPLSLNHSVVVKSRDGKKVYYRYHEISSPRVMSGTLLLGKYSNI